MKLKKLDYVLVDDQMCRVISSGPKNVCLQHKSLTSNGEVESGITFKRKVGELSGRTITKIPTGSAYSVLCLRLAFAMNSFEDLILFPATTDPSYVRELHRTVRASLGVMPECFKDGDIEAIAKLVKGFSIRHLAQCKTGTALSWLSSVQPQNESLAAWMSSVDPEELRVSRWLSDIQPNGLSLERLTLLLESYQYRIRIERLAGVEGLVIECGHRVKWSIVSEEQK